MRAAKRTAEQVLIVVRLLPFHLKVRLRIEERIAKIGAVELVGTGFRRDVGEEVE
jgi:hypothetical protein